MRLLRRRFSELETRIVAKVQKLSREQLEELIEDLLDFSELEDLDAWLGYPGLENNWKDCNKLAKMRSPALTITLG